MGTNPQGGKRAKNQGEAVDRSYQSSALVQLQDLLITAPARIREHITVHSSKGAAAQCLKLRANTRQLADPAQAAKLSLQTLAVRVRTLDEEITALDAQLTTLVSAAAPTLVSRVGISTGHAAQLLITAGQNIDRLTSEAAFARLCGVAPIQSHRASPSG